MKIQSTFFVVLGLVLTFACSQLHATLLVYNGFDHGGSDVNLHSTPLATNSTGLTGNYIVGTGNNGALMPFRYDADEGLSLGGNYLPSTGGAVYSSVKGNDNSSHNLNTQLDLTPNSVSGNLYGSFLMKLDSQTSQFITIVRGVDSGRSNGRFNAGWDDADTSASTLATSYDSSRTRNSFLSSNGVTYLFLSKFTNVGNAGGGIATSYLFDQTGYDAWFLAGSNEVDLGTYALSSVADTVGSGTFTFEDGDFVDFTNFVRNTNDLDFTTVIVDEIRFGTDLSDVVSVIPEPSSIILLLLGLPILGWGLRRRS